MLCGPSRMLRTSLMTRSMPKHANLCRPASVMAFNTLSNCCHQTTTPSVMFGLNATIDSQWRIWGFNLHCFPNRQVIVVACVNTFLNCVSKVSLLSSRTLNTLLPFLEIRLYFKWLNFVRFLLYMKVIHPADQLIEQCNSIRDLTTSFSPTRPLGKLSSDLREIFKVSTKGACMDRNLFCKDEIISKT